MKASAEIGARVAEVRKNFAPNTRQFALQHGFDPSVLARVEKGQAGLPEHYFVTITDTLKVNSNWLLRGEGPMFIDSKPQTVEESAVPYASGRAKGGLGVEDYTDSYIALLKLRNEELTADKADQKKVMDRVLALSEELAQAGREARALLAELKPTVADLQRRVTHNEGHIFEIDMMAISALERQGVKGDSIADLRKKAYERHLALMSIEQSPA